MEEIDVITAATHPTRRRLIDYLGLHGMCQVTTLARALSLQVGSVSHHLRILERAGIIERAENPTGDRRTSWWRSARTGFSWSVSDFEDSPADAVLAREAERLNTMMQMRRLSEWLRNDRSHPEWATAAFSTDTFAWATPDELRTLSEALQKTIVDWIGSIDRDDGAERRPVFIFGRGFPTEP